MREAPFRDENQGTTPKSRGSQETRLARATEDSRQRPLRDKCTQARGEGKHSALSHPKPERKEGGMGLVAMHLKGTERATPRLLWGGSAATAEQGARPQESEEEGGRERRGGRRGESCCKILCQDAGWDKVNYANAMHSGPTQQHRDLSYCRS